MNELTRGLIVDSSDTHYWERDGEIVYPSGNILGYARQSAQGPAYDFVYRLTDGRNIRLNDLVDSAEWILTPVHNNFQIRMPSLGSTLEHPEVQLSIPKLQEHEIALLAAFHEIGHANVYNALWHMHFQQEGKGATSIPEASLLLFQQLRPDAQLYNIHDQRTYALQLYSAAGVYSNTDWERTEKFHERLAWAYALRTVRKNRLLTGYDAEDFRFFYIPRLASYGGGCIKERNATNYYGWFVSGESSRRWTQRKEQRSWVKGNNAAIGEPIDVKCPQAF